MRITPFVQFLGPLAAVLILACGGGGGTTPSTPTQPPAPPTSVYKGNPLPTQGQTVNLLTETSWAPFPIPPYDGAPLPAKVDRTYRVGYSESLRNPLWSSYVSIKQTSYSALPDRTDFLQDPGSPAGVKHADFTNSGYTRGHMAPRADIGYHFPAADGAPQAGTFLMTNMCPQLEGHNTGIWETLEGYVCGRLESGNWTPGMPDKFGKVWVITGPVHSVSPKLLSTAPIAIPIGFYKIVVREDAVDQPKALAILTPHEDLDNSALPDYVTSVRRIETVTGLNFFPELSSSAQDALEKVVDVRGWGSPFERSGSPVQAHMVEPSWNLVVNAGEDVTFVGSALTATTGGSIATQSWDFGDGVTATGASVTHSFNNTTPTPRTFTVSYTATDNANATRTVQRQIQVKSSNPANTPPTISAIPNQATTKNTPLPSISFQVGDLETAPSALLVTANCSVPTLFTTAGIVFGGSGEARTLTLSPAQDQTGTAMLTVTVTDGGGLTASTVFQVSVSGGGLTPGQLIISQYYEGASNDKWMELTNVGGQALDLGNPQIYMVVFNNEKADNPSGVVPTDTSLLKLTGNLAPGSSILFKASGAAKPTYAVGTISSACNFNGDDLVILTTSIDASCWANRLDVIGNGTDWGANKSFYRIPNVLQPNSTYTPSEWIQKTNAEVDDAASGTSERLGVHLYTAPTLR